MGEGGGAPWSPPRIHAQRLREALGLSHSCSSRGPSPTSISSARAEPSGPPAGSPSTSTTSPFSPIARFSGRLMPSSEPKEAAPSVERGETRNTQCVDGLMIAGLKHLARNHRYGMRRRVRRNTTCWAPTPVGRRGGWDATAGTVGSGARSASPSDGGSVTVENKECTCDSCVVRGAGKDVERRPEQSREDKRGAHRALPRDSWPTAAPGTRKGSGTTHVHPSSCTRKWGRLGLSG